MTVSGSGLESRTALLSTGVRMHFYTAGSGNDVIVLLHGWPQTAWQWRHVMPLFAEAGYRVVAPDLRGAGNTSRPRLDDGVAADPRGPGLPRGGYSKWSLAEDIHQLLHDELGITEPALVVGHDIGAMVATAYALRYRVDVRGLCFGEAPLPGTQAYEQMKDGPAMFHFAFHSILDLPEALTAGHERVYLQHFYDKLGVRPTAVDTEHYVSAFLQAGAMRAGFDLYRAFEQDARDTAAALAEGGKITVPVLGVHGQISAFSEVTEEMGLEIAERVEVQAVAGAGHWMAEENPTALAEIITRFDHDTRATANRST